MQLDNLNFDELRTEATADNEKKVRDALKTLLGGIDQMIEMATDPEELAEFIDWISSQLKSGKASLRDHKPIAQLSAGGAESTPQFTVEELELIDKLRARANGNLANVISFVENLQTERDTFERQLNERTAQLQAASNSANVIDADQAKAVKELENKLRKANSDLADAQAQLAVTPKEYQDLIKVFKEEGEVAPTRLGSRTEYFRVPMAKLSDRQIDILEV
jgi:chromosome segregation ATPase